MDNQVSKRLVTIHNKSKENPDWVWQKGSLYNLMYNSIPQFFRDDFYEV